MKNILISPSILNVDSARLTEECLSLQNCGADWIHCDVMDGVFVPNVSLGVSSVRDIKKCVNIPLDVHLMIENPINQVENYVKVGANIVTFHLEAASDVAAVAKKIRNCGAKVGISVKPNTPIEELSPFADLFDMVLIMTVEPGFGGQKFIEQSVQKIRRARELFPDKLIEVDGGINADTAQLAVRAGADVLVAGSYIISAPNRMDAIDKLRNV